MPYFFHNNALILSFKLLSGNVFHRPSSLPLTPDKIFIQSIDREHFLLNVLLTWKCSYAKWAQEPLQTLNPLLHHGESWKGVKGKREHGSQIGDIFILLLHACLVCVHCLCAWSFYHSKGIGNSIGLSLELNSRNCLEAARSMSYLHSTLPAKIKAFQFPSAYSKASKYLAYESPLLLVR